MNTRDWVVGLLDDAPTAQVELFTAKIGAINALREQLVSLAIMNAEWTYLDRYRGDLSKCRKTELEVGRPQLNPCGYWIEDGLYLGADDTADQALAFLNSWGLSVVAQTRHSDFIAVGARKSKKQAEIALRIHKGNATDWLKVQPPLLILPICGTPRLEFAMSEKASASALASRLMAEEMEIASKHLKRVLDALSRHREYVTELSRMCNEWIETDPEKHSGPGRRRATLDMDEYILVVKLDLGRSDTIESGIADLVLPFAEKFGLSAFKHTPREIHFCDLGNTSIEGHFVSADVSFHISRGNSERCELDSNGTLRCSGEAAPSETTLRSVRPAMTG